MHLAAEARDIEMLSRLGGNIFDLPPSAADNPTIKELAGLVRQLGEAREAENRMAFMKLVNDEDRSGAAFLLDEKGLSQLHHIAKDDKLNLMSSLLSIASTSGVIRD